ncbi:tescalcin a [Amia ocellicauda]|uniref:tescalcin a n=1 Tax=Amia ocellicauda TaxID=2972642 RepID=UPI0034641B89
MSEEHTLNTKRTAVPMGALHSAAQEHDFGQLAEDTGFSLEQTEILYKRFKQLSQNEDTLQREALHSIPDLQCNPLKTQIVEAFFDKRNFEKDGRGKVHEIGFEQFLTTMAHFRPPQINLTAEEREDLRKEKLRFLFNMHDTDNDGTITLEEYRHVVEELLSKSGNIEMETASAIADAAMLEVASISVGPMTPDEVYEGITFEHFLKILNGLEIETRMHIRFLNMDTTTLCK